MTYEHNLREYTTYGDNPQDMGLQARSRDQALSLTALKKNGVCLQR
jgi:hypothetical protein